MMTDTTENDKSASYNTVTSDQLIAEAYAAIKLSERDYDLPKPTGSPVPVKDAPAADASTTRGGRAKSASSSRQQSKRAPQQQSTSKRMLSSSPTQPPPPSGAPVSPIAKPIRASRQALTTSSDSEQTNSRTSPGVYSFPSSTKAQDYPGTSTPQSPQRTSRPQMTQTPPPQQKRKSSGWGTLLFWIIFILIVFRALPHLRIFD